MNDVETAWGALSRACLCAKAAAPLRDVGLIVRLDNAVHRDAHASRDAQEPNATCTRRLERAMPGMSWQWFGSAPDPRCSTSASPLTSRRPLLEPRLVRNGTWGVVLLRAHCAVVLREPSRESWMCLAPYTKGTGLRHTRNTRQAHQTQPSRTKVFGSSLRSSCQNRWRLGALACAAHTAAALGTL